MHDMMGANWTDFMPASWASPSFDWSRLGEFGERQGLWGPARGGGGSLPGGTRSGR